MCVCVCVVLWVNMGHGKKVEDGKSESKRRTEEKKETMYKRHSLSFRVFLASSLSHVTLPTPTVKGERGEEGGE